MLKLAVASRLASAPPLKTRPGGPASRASRLRSGPRGEIERGGAGDTELVGVLPDAGA